MTDSAAEALRKLNKVLNLFLCFLARALKGPPLHSNVNICNLSCVLYVNVESCVLGIALLGITCWVGGFVSGVWWPRWLCPLLAVAREFLRPNLVPVGVNN